MKYMIMVYTNPRGWEQLSDTQRADFGRAHAALYDELAASGELIAAAGLADPLLASVVSVRDGRITTTDGPFAEVKEHLAGFYLIEVESLDDAIAHAAKAPDAAYGQVEVRPIFDRSVLDL
jgi:hypothetical protein